MSSPLDNRIIQGVSPLSNDHSLYFGDCYNISQNIQRGFAITRFQVVWVLCQLSLFFCAWSQGEIAMKSQGEIESAICEGVNRFEQEYMGRGPKHIHAHLIGDLLVVRLQGVLTAAEQHLVLALTPEKGRDLLKEVRTQLIETARSALEKLVQEITGVKPISLHHDISTLTGEEIIVFTLAEEPLFRESRKK